MKKGRPDPQNPNQNYAYAGQQLLADLEAIRSQTASRAQEKRAVAWIWSQSERMLREISRQKQLFKQQEV